MFARSWTAMLSFCLVLLAALLAWRCGSVQPDPPTAGETTASKEIASATNDFGLRLLRTITDGKRENVIISPLSISLALDMTYNGAAGDTKTAMAKTLGIESLSDEALNSDVRSLLATILKADPAVQLEIANALWPQANFSIADSFAKLSRDFFDASVEGVDFANDPVGAAKRINNWVNDKTHGKIPSIVGIPAATTRLILTDAVYFKGRWSVPFDRKNTSPRVFHTSGGGTVTAPMMVQNGKYEYFDNESFQAIQLPYGQSRFAMYVFLPRKNDGLPEFLKSLDKAHWNDWNAKFMQRKGKIVLPKLESTYSKKLNDPLTNMGMSIAFEQGRADFSRIHPPPPSLNIDDVEHKTYVKVDEEGTEAAAATSVGIVGSAVGGPPPFEMIVEHPFFCAIVEQQSGVMLFAGVVTNPEQK
jgi:serine protease inhibitor